MTIIKPCVIGQYVNGNYNVTLFDDGTKIRETNKESLKAEFPEAIDLKITDHCELNCPFCYEEATINGVHADLSTAGFIYNIEPFTEIAIGGGDPLSHPDLYTFLRILKSKSIVANITVNQVHFLNNLKLINDFIDKNLIKGIGVSLTNPIIEFIDTAQSFKNLVIHVINGVHSVELLKNLYDKRLKLLILGYKDLGRGVEFKKDGEVEKRKLELYENLADVVTYFEVVAFDNLALKQLEVKRLVYQKQWDEFYMGDDGQFSMYIDAVKKQFAVSSTNAERFDCGNLTTREMFNIVREKASKTI